MIKISSPETAEDLVERLQLLKEDDRPKLAEAAKDFIEENSFKGINKDKCARTRHWRARYYVKGKSKTIGRYKSKSEAILARVKYINNLKESPAGNQSINSYIPYPSSQV